MLRFLYSPWLVFGGGVWYAAVLFTPVSLYGFWTDVFSFGLFLGWIAFIGIRGGYRLIWLNALGPLMLALGLVFPMLLVASLGGVLVVADVAQTRSVPQVDKVQGMWLVNQYFKPTGAYGCGMGSLTTAKAPVFFPFIEYRTEFEPCVHDDYGCFIDRGSWEACGY